MKIRAQLFETLRREPIPIEECAQWNTKCPLFWEHLETSKENNDFSKNNKEAICRRDCSECKKTIFMLSTDSDNNNNTKRTTPFVLPFLIQNQIAFKSQLKDYPVNSNGIQLVLMGAAGTGKTNLCTQFVQKVFSNAYDPTLENSYRKSVEIDEKNLTLELLDTGGQEDFASMRNIYCADGKNKAFMLVYDVTNKTSFVECKSLLELILSKNVDTSRENFSILLVGNKIDVVDESSSTDFKKKKREVSTEDGINFANENNTAFIETSAYANRDVFTAFYGLVRLLFYNRHMQEKKNLKD